jgi:hypothetical protein
MIYLLTSDGYRDSLELENYATDDEGLLKILIREQLIYGNEVIPNSVKIDFNKRTIYFRYTEMDGYEDERTYEFIAISPI